MQKTEGVKEEKITEHEAQAVFLASRISGKPERSFQVVNRPEPEHWYDWTDPETGKMGQCRMGSDGRWVQSPLGVQPVILAFKQRR